MSLEVRVAGGTGAGKKRPLLPTPPPWECRCYVFPFEGSSDDEVIETGPPTPRVNPGYLAACPDCGAVRPS